MVKSPLLKTTSYFNGDLKTDDNPVRLQRILRYLNMYVRYYNTRVDHIQHFNDFLSVKSQKYLLQTHPPINTASNKYDVVR